jgi:cold shock CspA family protein
MTQAIVTKQGVVTKIVSSYGARWGEVRPDQEPRQLFFNHDSLSEGLEFTSLVLGDRVEFSQEQDRANGLRAIEMRRI